MSYLNAYRISRKVCLEKKTSNVSMIDRLRSILAIRFTLISHKKEFLQPCQKKIEDLARSYSTKIHLVDKVDLKDWSNETIKQYYQYCLTRRVVPQVDIEKATLELRGPKDAVDTRRCSYRMTI
jgi:hypothetical protein